MKKIMLLVLAAVFLVGITSISFASLSLRADPGADQNKLRAPISSEQALFAGLIFKGDAGWRGMIVTGTVFGKEDQTLFKKKNTDQSAAVTSGKKQVQGNTITGSTVVPKGFILTSAAYYYRMNPVDQHEGSNGKQVLKQNASVSDNHKMRTPGGYMIETLRV